MTRPMPAPHGLPKGWFALDYGPIYNSRGQEVPTKHLTDAECAAEYWHAVLLYWTTNEGAPYADRNIEARRAATWHRFATHPHALTETPNDRP